MIIRKALPLALACGFLVSTSQPTKAITVPPMVEHTAKLAAAAFLTNLLGYYCCEKLYSTPTQYTILRNALMSSIGAAGVITDICLVRSAIFGNLLENSEKKQSK